jgi:release factor glutamine methyltransferase
MNAREAAAEAAKRLAAAGVEDARFEGELLTRESAGLTRAAFFLDPEVPAEAVEQLEGWVERRVEREPAQYITGHREFYGREFAVGQGVLIPRPETELLVDLAIAEVDANPDAVIWEIGTGSGAVAVSVAAERPGAKVAATEVSSEAMRFAAYNALRHAPHLGLVLGDLAAPVRRADVVLANLPYIPTWEIDALEPEVSKWEPRVALDGGDDGFALIRRLVDDCANRLRPRLLALEVGFGQADAVGEIVSEHGPEPWFVKDLAGIDRIVCSRWQ